MASSTAWNLDSLASSEASAHVAGRWSFCSGRTQRRAGVSAWWTEHAGGRATHLLALAARDDAAVLAVAPEQALVRVLDDHGERAEAARATFVSTPTEKEEERAGGTHGHFSRPSSAASSTSFSCLILCSATIDLRGRKVGYSLSRKVDEQPEVDMQGRTCTGRGRASDQHRLLQGAGERHRRALKRNAQTCACQSACRRSCARSPCRRRSPQRRRLGPRGRNERSAREKLGASRDEGENGPICESAQSAKQQPHSK